jgi:hypothetical protein
MSEITKYMVTGLGINLANNSIIAGYDEVTDCEQPICMWSDVEPIIQRNKELEAELARLREQEPEYYVSTEEERDIALNTLAEMFESAEESEGEDGMLMSVDISLWNEGCEALEVLIGGEDDVDPTIQHNKELEAEIKRLREHVDSLSCGVSREAWHDTAWSLLQSKAIEDSEIMKVNIHTVRAIFNATYDALAGSALTKQKPAQEIPAELVKWVNNDEPNLEMDDSADVALEKIVRNECRAFVKSQLEKMKCGA